MTWNIAAKKCKSNSVVVNRDDKKKFRLHRSFGSATHHGILPLLMLRQALQRSVTNKVAEYLPAGSYPLPKF
jgi:hypothetical protein